MKILAIQNRLLKLLQFVCRLLLGLLWLLFLLFLEKEMPFISAFTI